MGETKPNTSNTIFFSFSYWNGGGQIRNRLRTNPGLRNLIQKKPDFFIYAEALISSYHELGIDGYLCYLHKSKVESPNNYRRGLAIFYLKKYRFLFTKVYACRTYDIVWMRLTTISEPLHFCFFYAPGSHHPLPDRERFYDIFSTKFADFAALGKVYLIGDTNARLGSVLNDTNFKGQLISNPNQHLFLEFLEFSGLSILNTKYCR